MYTKFRICCEGLACLHKEPCVLWAICMLREGCGELLGEHELQTCFNDTLQCIIANIAKNLSLIAMYANLFLQHIHT